MKKSLYLPRSIETDDWKSKGAEWNRPQCNEVDDDDFWSQGTNQSSELQQ